MTHWVEKIEKGFFTGHPVIPDAPDSQAKMIAQNPQEFTEVKLNKYETKRYSNGHRLFSDEVTNIAKFK